MQDHCNVIQNIQPQMQEKQITHTHTYVEIIG